MGSFQRRKQSRKGQSMQSMPFNTSQLMGNQIISRSATSTSHRRSKTPSKLRSHSKSKTFGISISYDDMFQFSLSCSPKDDSFDNEIENEPTDKNKLWQKYASKQTYSAILFKRGKYNTNFKKRWLVLCENKKNKNEKNVVRGASNSFVFNKGSFGDSNPYKWNSSNNVLHENKEHKKKKKAKNASGAYLFYFNERPIKDSDLPNGYINLRDVQCVIGLFDDDNDDRRNLSKEKKIKYLKNKAKESEYYEIVLKTKDREWIFGAIDSSGYASWLIRLKKFE